MHCKLNLPMSFRIRLSHHLSAGQKESCVISVLAAVSFCAVFGLPARICLNLSEGYMNHVTF